MSIVDKSTLKTSFQTGATPTGSDFEDFIDSTPSVLEDNSFTGDNTFNTLQIGTGEFNEEADSNRVLNLVQGGESLANKEAILGTWELSGWNGQYQLPTNKTAIINAEIMGVVDNDFDIASWEYKLIAQNNGVTSEIVKIRDANDGTTKDVATYYAGNMLDETLGEAQVSLWQNTWTPVESARYWYSVAMSSDGMYQTAVAWNNNQIYISSDYGATWTPVESARDWYSVAMSSDGMYQTAVVINGQIYISSDYGATWTPVESARYWYSVAMSSDGMYQTAVAFNKQIYISKFFGRESANTIMIVCKNDVDTRWSANLRIQELTSKSQPAYS